MNPLDPAKRQFMRLHVRDLLSSLTWTTASATARGIYLSLICHSFLAPDGVLRGSERDLQRLAGATPEEWAEHWPAISRKFPPRHGGIANPRVRAEIAHSVRASRRGRRAISVRWGTGRYGRNTDVIRTKYGRNTDVIPRAGARAGSESNSSSSSDSLRESSSSSDLDLRSFPKPNDQDLILADEKQTPKKPTKPRKRSTTRDKIPDETPGFVAWYSGDGNEYAGYPRKVARSAAARAYRTRIRAALAKRGLAAGEWAQVDPEVSRYLIERVRYQQAFPAGEGLNRDRTYIPHPSTWLNSGSYADEPGDE